MKITNRQLRRFCYYAPIFCSMAVLSSQLHAAPTIQLNGDESRDGIADSGRIGYVGGNTRIGVSVDRDLQGQVDINQIILDDDSSATSVEGWFGYKLEDDELGSKGVDSGGAKLNHQWVNDDADTVHKVFGAYDRNSDDLQKVTVGYGQETEDLFWAGRLSKGLDDKISNGDVDTRGYDYGIGGEVGTFLESTQTRIRGGLDYEFGTEHADNEDRPSNLTVSAGVEQFFHDTPHSISLDVSGSRKEGGADATDTDFNARLGYRYEFGGGGAYQSDSTVSRRRVEIPGTPARPGRAGRAGIPGTRGTPAVPARPAIAAQPGRPAQPAVPPRYERQLVKKPGHEFVKTTMKLENETFFKLNSSQLTKSAKNNLNKIVGQVRGHGYVGAIRITGNTCGLGDPIYDQRLSENRANAVRDYLIEQGFNPDHLIARGLGKGSPKYNRQDNDFKNRRVDLEFMTERSTRKQTAQSYYKNVLVQEGRPAIPGIAARPGRPATPGRPAIPGRAAVLAIPAIPATPGTPSRFVWKTEVVKSAPIWIKRAVRNTIRHDRTINTYTTRAAAKVSNDTFTLSDRTGLLDVLGNDSAGSELVSVTQPANGTVTIVGGLVRYVPRAGFSGSDSFTYTVRDRNGNEQTATVTVDVPVALNNAPVAVDDVDTTPENTAITINALSNDTDTESDPLTVAITGNPTNGTASVVNGQIVYTPTAGFVGTDTITYSITDPDGESDTATITITVSNVNVAPAAVNDSRTTPEDTAVTINVLANDSDADGDTISLDSNGSPENGSAAISGNNIIYTPDAGFVGTDTFTYVISDPDGQTATATVNVTVTNVNMAPTAVNDSRTTPEDTAITIDVLTNDTDADGDTISLDNNGSPENGSAAISGNNIIYTPDAGFVGTDTFTYVISDPDGQTATATVNVTITNVNMAPTAVNDSRTTPEDTAVTINVLANDSDADGDTISLDSNGSPENGSAAISGNTIIYTPDAGFVGTDTFTYVISDPDGQTATATVDVTITNVNMAPVAVDDAKNTPEDTAVTISVLPNDSDPDGDAISIDSFTQGGNGTVTASGNDFIYTPTSGFIGTDSFTYTISDPDGLTSTATVAVTINNVNKAPTPSNDSRSTPEDTPITIDVLTNDSDPDGDSFTLTSNTAPIMGSASINGNNIVYTPNPGFAGTDIFDYTVTDSNGATQMATVTVTVVSVNKAPTPADDNATTPQDTPITMDVLANDTDPDGDSLTITRDGAAPNGTTTTSGNQIVYTPDAGFTGVDSYTYTVSDGNGNTATAVGTVTVTPVANQAPTANDETAVTHQDTAITLNVIGNDTDPEGDTLTITSDGSAPNGTTTTNGSNQIVYTPDAGFTGTDSFTYTISDGNGNTDTATVTVTVNPTKNESPVANNESATTPQDTPITLNVIGNDTDPEGDTLTITSDGSAPNGNTTTSGNQIVYTPEPGFSGEDSFTYTISDGNGGTDTATVTVTVTPAPNEAPIAGGDNANTEFETPVTINVALNDFDPDGTTTCVSGIASNPTSGSVVIEPDGVSITYTPNNGFFGFDTFVYTACDVDGATDTATVHVAVFEPK